MTQSLNLAGTWRVTWTDGVHGPCYAPFFKYADPGRYIDVPVPMELHAAMEKAGLAEDANFGIGSLTTRWIEEQYWQYYRTFDVPEEALAQSAWLVFDQLDIIAQISLNGEVVGNHQNVHRPCRIDVTGKLKAGENTLIVVVESGYYYTQDRDGVGYGYGGGPIFSKRHWLRKPQYQYGWDWNPRLVNVGITGGVRLEWNTHARIDQVAAWSDLRKDHAKATITARTFIEGIGEGTEVKLTARIRETGQEASETMKLKVGVAPYDLQIAIDNPKLWWPVGHGKQFQYNVDIAVEAEGNVIDSTTRRVGIRSLEIDRSKHPAKGEYFIIVVNGRNIFCKGGNWVPPDLLYSRGDRARCKELVDLALEANFTMLRIWGGGTYAGNDLLDLCDEAGLLVWHDMPFACGKYPADNADYLAEVTTELTWAVREFSPHASLAVWCGNNEQEWGMYDWGKGNLNKVAPDYNLYHLVMPRICMQEDPLRPYWPSSPYSPDFSHPNDPTIGDQHPWNVTLMSDGSDFWAYRNYVDRFANEGGVLGTVNPATYRNFLPEDQRKVRSFMWEHHDNTCNVPWDGVGVAYRAVEYWLGRPYSDLTDEEYIFTSSLLQAEGLMEYIVNYRRRMYSSASAIFWMYNDSWPATHSWTIIDYYRRKKLSFHPVRRAFQPVSVVVAEEDDKIRIFGVNDSADDWKGTLRYGFFALAGGKPVNERKEVTLKANASTVLAEMPKADFERLGLTTHGAFGVLDDARGIKAQHRFFLARFKELAFAEPQIEIKREGDFAVLSSPVFVWGASLDFDGEIKIGDNCVDLLPGIPYRIPWPAEAGEPKVLATGNCIFRKYAGKN